ncbi:MAG: SirB2 family protein [Pseudomonadales bacterium]|nr:SirB2 family protein [Pseudomonadales bacterium]
MRPIVNVTLVGLDWTGFDLVKSIHMLAAFVSILGFVIRGLLMISESSMLQQRWIKVVPHINDTVLLTSAITLAIMSSQNPMDHRWLTAKVAALIVYILLGLIALRFGKTKRHRIVAWSLAIATFGYIVSVALTHNPLGFLA